MQAVILAAGRGTRMGALTETTPKPLLMVNGKSLIEHKLDALPKDIDHVILVVQYRQEMIRAAFGASFGGRRISYIEQADSTGGTADALYRAQSLLEGRFLVLMGDDLYAPDDIRRLIAEEWALLAARVADVSVGGCLKVDDGVLTDIIEHRASGSGLVSTNLFMLDTRLFSQSPVPKAPGSTELGLPQTVLAASRSLHIPLSVIETESWIQITNSSDLTQAATRYPVHTS